MLTCPLFTQDGKAIGEATLAESVFGVKPNVQVMRRAIEAQQRNSRVAIAHTKTRSEVRGGGKKPWRQKGTGRARHGSIRSPIWVGGGVTFGPRNIRNYTSRINRKERRSAILMGLSQKAHEKKIIALDALTIPAIKTKTLATLLRKLPLRGRSTLLLQPKRDPLIAKSARNIPKVQTIAANSVNIVDILRHEYLLVPQESFAVLQKTFQQNATP